MILIRRVTWNDTLMRSEDGMILTEGARRYKHLGLGWYDTTRVLIVVWKVLRKRASTLVEQQRECNDTSVR